MTARAATTRPVRPGRLHRAGTLLHKAVTDNVGLKLVALILALTILAVVYGARSGPPDPQRDTMDEPR